MPTIRTLLPAQPILDHIATRGELSDFFPQEEYEQEPGIVGGEWGDKRTSGFGGFKRARIHPDYIKSFKLHEQRIVRARKTGVIDMFFADELCCDVFHLHPVALYGPAWYETPVDPEEQKALGGYPQIDEYEEEEALAA